MEQTTQQTDQKPVFPTKTKIAAWYIIIFGIIFSGYQFSKVYSLYKSWKEYGSFGISPFSAAVFPLISGILFDLLIGIFLLKRRKTAWNYAVVIFFIIFIGGLFGLLIAIFQKDFGSVDKFLSFLFLSTLIPVVLLLLDRKNFFKIAH